VKENEKGIARSFVVLFTIFIIILLFFIIRQGKEALPLRSLPLAYSQVGKKATGIIIIIFFHLRLSLSCVYTVAK
jgi:preprotein translocase subunit SecG